MDLFRETAAGQIIRLCSRGKLLQYPEELPDFQVNYPTHSKLDTSPPGPGRMAFRPSDASSLERGQFNAQASLPAGDGHIADDKLHLVDWYTSS
jgi:hypothetical protein